MKGSVVVLSALCALQLIVIGVLGYFVVDRSVSLHHMEQGQKLADRSVLSMQALLAAEYRGAQLERVKTAMLRAAQEAPKLNVVVKEDGESIWFDQTEFNFSQGRLTRVGQSAVPTSSLSSRSPRPPGAPADKQTQ